MDMHHIVFSKCTVKRCKSRCAYRCKAFFLYRWNVLLPDSLIVRVINIVILCAAYMMSRPVITGHLTALLCHPRAQLLYNDFYAALSRQSLLSKYRNSKVSLHLVSPTVFLPCTIFYSPRPSKHTLKVLKIIFQSTQKLRSLTYFTSRSIHSSKERSLRCGAICQ